MSSIQHAVAAAVLTLAVPAFAQDTYADPVETPENTDMVGTENPSTRGVVKQGNLPPPRSDSDPIPPAARAATSSGIVKQAGVGGAVAYGRAGVLELGGSAAFTSASDFTSLQVNPSIGWFFQDNLQISGILGVNFSQVQGLSTTFFTLLAEPSYHLPVTNTVFPFLGIGVGATYAEPAGVGFAVAPRLGVNVLVGRSGVLSPALFLNYSTGAVAQTPQGTLLRVNTAYGFQLGYTVML